MKYLMLLLLPLLLFSCSEEDCCVPPPFAEQLIFGTVHGFCTGEECIRLYKLKNGVLYAESGAETINDLEAIPFLDTPLAANDYTIAKAADTEFPSAIYQETKERIGCPDCADQGLYFLRKGTTDGDFNTWYIDTDTTAIPDYLRNYVLLLEQIMEEIK